MPVDIFLAQIDVASAHTKEEAIQETRKHNKAAMEESIDQFTFTLKKEIDPGKRIRIITELVEVLQLDVYINDLFPALMGQIEKKLARLT